MAPVCKRRNIRLSRQLAGLALTALLCLCPPLLLTKAIGETGTKIVVNSGRYGPYYHLQYKLTAAAIDFARSDRLASSGGQFELRLRPEHFPVPAPNCRDSLILRMPWTAPNTPKSAKKIAVKQDLLKRILAIEQVPDATVPVVLELNPYVKIISTTPLRLQLTQCNIFFRHAFGGYVDYTGPVQRH